MRPCYSWCVGMVTKDGMSSVIRRRVQDMSAIAMNRLYNGKKYKIALLLLFVPFLVFNIFLCSTTKSKDVIRDLCDLYHQGQVAGNVCHKLCDEHKFTFSHCGNNHVGKFVLMMSCVDCGPNGKIADVVVKSKFGLDRWTQNNKVFFNKNESPTSMINRSKEVINRQCKVYGVDVLKQNDSLSYIWQHNFDAYVNVGDGGEEGVRERTSVGLQSILGLITQEEYATMIWLHETDYIPRLYGSCGPAYFVEYTPSFPYLGYILYQGKLPEILSLKPKLVPWADRARAALQVLRIFKYFENHVPPVYMCDIQTHNFGINMQQRVTVLDTDSLKYKQIAPNRVCYKDGDCDVNTCLGSCNLKNNTCHDAPINSHIQVACWKLFRSNIPRFGLLRGPPLHVRDELEELIQECVSPSKPAVIPWRSDEVLYKKFLDILYLSLSR